MRNSAKNATIALSLAAMFTGISLVPQVATAGPSDVVAQGKAIAWNKKQGNCLACHVMAGGTSPGTIGPPLIAMKARFPDRQKLFDQIYDATKANPDTQMPPFGKNKILSASQINKVVDYLYTL